MDHYGDSDTDRCGCGGEIVYFEDGDQFGIKGEGCEVGNLVFVGRVALPLTDQQAFLLSEGAGDGPCLVCGAEWKEMSPGSSSREIWHKEDCAYINFYEDEGSN
jgi:hypothetical protein